MPTLSPANRDRQRGAFDQILMSRKNCENCGREFLIVDGVPMTEDQFHRRDR